MVEVTTHYLEMKSRSALVEKGEIEELRIVECEIKQFQFNRFLYELVGSDWEWTERLAWSDQQWKAYAESDGLRTWVAYCEGAPAGYFELHRQNGGDVEIAYFGLAPAFIGRGFGGALLSNAIARAWDWEGTGRVWVHTCSLDHPNALANYKARGLEVYKVETARQDDRPSTVAETIEPAPVKPSVAIDDLSKIDIRVGTILAVDDVEGSKKLVRLTVDLGDRQRTILAGMKQEREDPSEIVGRQALFVVNLEPRKMAGFISEGMLFDIGYEDGVTPVLAGPEKPVPNGVRAG